MVSAPNNSALKAKFSNSLDLELAHLQKLDDAVWLLIHSFALSFVSNDCMHCFFYDVVTVLCISHKIHFMFSY